MAGRKALQRADLTIDDIDLLIFASASQDLIEPATSHIVASLLGANGVPVMDVVHNSNILGVYYPKNCSEFKKYINEIIIK